MADCFVRVFSVCFYLKVFLVRLGLRFVIRNESERKQTPCFDNQICRIAESVFGCNCAPPDVFLYGNKSVGGINMKCQIFLVDDYRAVFGLNDNPA